MIEDFRQFISDMVLSDDDVRIIKTWHKDNWWYHDAPMMNDLNKEIIHPGVIDTLPDGGVGIRSDENFFAEGIFPYGFRDLTIEEIASICWPNYEFAYGRDVTAV